MTERRCRTGFEVVTKSKWMDDQLDAERFVNGKKQAHQKPEVQMDQTDLVPRHQLPDKRQGLLAGSLFIQIENRIAVGGQPARPGGTLCPVREEKDRLPSLGPQRVREIQHGRDKVSASRGAVICRDQDILTVVSLVILCIHRIISISKQR